MCVCGGKVCVHVKYGERKEEKRAHFDLQTSVSACVGRGVRAGGLVCVGPGVLLTREGLGEGGWQKVCNLT